MFRFKFQNQHTFWRINSGLKKKKFKGQATDFVNSNRTEQWNWVIMRLQHSEHCFTSTGLNHSYIQMRWTSAECFLSRWGYILLFRRLNVECRLTVQQQSNVVFLLFYQLLPEAPSCPRAPVRPKLETRSGSLSRASSWDLLQWVSNTVSLNRDQKSVTKG